MKENIHGLHNKKTVVQITVVQEKSAMKICTDATLFGAMTPVIGGETVLDIGAGSGLLALMAAQLGVARVIAVELTEEAFTEAKLNFANSPWSSQLQIIHNDIQSYAKTCRHSFDLIISNPPFFDSHSKAKDELRSIARHTDRLPFTDLISIAAQLLSASGTFYLLMPTHAVEAIVVLAQMNLHIWHNETKYRAGEGDGNLGLTHGLNGIRNTAKNKIQENLVEGGRKDYKVDCIAADFAIVYSSFLFVIIPLYC